MTIDEAIAKLRSNAIMDKYNMCGYSMEQHEQIAEWLEELKARREADRTSDSKPFDVLLEQRYNKAIDDFVERLNEKCDAMIKEKWNSNVAPISWAEAYSDFKDDIDEIAKQLKVG